MPPPSSPLRIETVPGPEVVVEVDVIVIGSGQAGVPLAARLAEAGRTVVLVERSHLGGTCVNYGCTPTKTMIASARAAHVARTSAGLGVRVGPVEVDFPAVVARKDALVHQWREEVRTRLQKAGDGLSVLHGHARFTGPQTIRVDDREMIASTIIINTGARPAVPPVPGLDTVPWLDNAGLMALPRLPDHLIVLGGGYIGCELGQAFRRFGSRVTLVDRNQHLLSREDPEASEALEEVFRGEGIDLRLGVGVDRVESRNGGVRLHLAGGRLLDGSHLLVATGRTPNTDDLGVDRAGLELGEAGHIPVDDRYRTAADGVYAVGDVTGGPQFTHTSWDDHRILFDLLNGEGRRTRADRITPYAVFTDPQVARVGLSEREARAQGVRHEVATMAFDNVARARETDRRAGTMKVIIDSDTERVLGATLVGAEAGELIHMFALLISADAPARALVDMEAVHPTFAEGVHSLVMRLDRYSL